MRCILRTGLKALRFVDRALEVLIFDLLLAPRRRAWVLGLAAVAVLGMLVQRAASSSRPSHGKNILLERPWLDHLPKDEHDRYQALVFNEEGYGVSLQATAYTGQWELFVFKAKDGKLQVLFPNDRRRAETKYKVAKVEHRTFDLQLTLEDTPFGPKTYYSWKKHKSKGLQTLRSVALEHWLLPAKELGKELRWPQEQ